MESWVLLMAGLAVGVSLGAGWVWWRLAAQVQNAQAQHQAAQVSHAQALAQAQARAEALERQLAEQKSQMPDQMKVMFQAVAQQVLEDRGRVLTEQSQNGLKALLDPMAQRLQEFQAKVDLVYHTEAKERHALQNEVKSLMELNLLMRDEASSLTRALKGDNKTQGDWGEMILERILESSGLQEGREYILQPTYKNDDGSMARPDVVIQLPENKHLIIDAKMSLVAYEAYCAASDDTAQKAHLKAHRDSVWKHVTELSERHYARAKGLNSPDFVFMFLPIEPAYILAMTADRELTQKAWDKRVAVVSATTLFTSLKTVALIWKQEQQSQNAEAIAAEGGKLYDKFVGFTEDFQGVRDALDSAIKRHDEARTKLSGKGGIASKVEKLRELGIAPKKAMDQDLLQ